MIYFVNQTQREIAIDIENQHILIKSNGRISVDNKSNKISFNCYTYENSTFKRFKIVSFFICGYHFILNSFYDIEAIDNAEIYLTERESKGNNLDTYKYIDISSNDISINNAQFTVKDEVAAKEYIHHYSKKEEKYTKIAQVLDILQTILYVGVPGLIIFIGIWYVSNITIAFCITASVGIIGVICGLLIKKLINHFNKKIEEKLPQKNDIYENTDSFFNTEYIRSVIKNHN